MSGRGGSRGSDRGGRGGGAGQSRGRGGGGFRGRGGFGGGFDSGPPAEVHEMGSFIYAVEGEMLCSSTNSSKVPYFNAPIYLANKTAIGKVDEILGPINQVYFTIKMSEGMIATSFSAGDKVFIAGDKLLPIERFLPKPPGEKIPKRGGAARGGRGGGTGGGGRGTPRGRGFSRGSSRGGGGRRGSFRGGPPRGGGFRGGGGGGGGGRGRGFGGGGRGRGFGGGRGGRGY